MYTRRVLAGEFQVVNPHLLKVSRSRLCVSLLSRVIIHCTSSSSSCQDLTRLGLWDEDTKNRLIAEHGSVQVCSVLAGWLLIVSVLPFFVHSLARSLTHSLTDTHQNMEFIPQPIKNLYKTVWEIKQKTLIDMAADRGAFIDQSQSFNVHMPNPNFG